MENNLVNILLAFVTGLTTGGLSCLAVQGGLLASSLAGQIETDLQSAAAKTGRNQPAAQKRSGMAQPILAFLAAKMLAYTLLGFLLGWLGQMFQLSPFARAFLQIAIGIFMLGTALRMFNVHPIFRYFAFEPPAFLRRRLRKTAAASGQSTLAAPLFLGFLTVLIPCGVTQAMMALALGTGSPLQGAALLFAFTLGTSPVFFTVAYFTTRLGARLEKNFMRFVAVVVLVMGIITIDSGITLAGSPVSLSRLLGGALSQPGTAQAAPARPALQSFDPASVELAPAQAAGGENVVTVNVLDNGYEPGVVHAKAGVPVTLRLVSKDVHSCSRAFVVPALGVEKILKATGEEFIQIPAQEKGAQMPFSCSMGMYSGTIIFDL